MNFMMLCEFKRDSKGFSDSYKYKDCVYWKLTSGKVACIWCRKPLDKSSDPSTMEQS